MKRIFSLFAAAAVLTSSVSALELKVLPDAALNKVKVYGKAAANDVITMMITSGLAEDGSITSDNANDVIFGGGQIRADEEGNFERYYDLDNKPNDSWYTVKVFSKTEGETETEKVFIPDSETNALMLEEFDEAADDNIKALCEKYTAEIPILRIDMNEFSTYETEICEAVIAKRAALAGGFSGATAQILENTIKSAFAEVNLAKCDAAGVDTYISKYSESMEIKLDEKYESVKTETAELFVKLRSEDSKAEVSELFEKSMALTVLNNSLRTEIEGVLRKYNDKVFKLNLKAFDKYDSVEISKALYAQSYKSTDAVKSDYDDRVAALGAASGNKPGSGGSGGGGGGAGGRPSGGNTGSDKVNNVYVGVDLYKEVDEEIQLPFEDLEQVEWAKDYIRKLYSSGIVSGVSKSEYKPSQAVTRAEICKLICSALETEKIVGDNPFSDVYEDAWYYDYVINAYDNEIVVGSDGRFMPEDNILRRDLAVIIARSLDSMGFDEISGHTFDDITESDLYAKDAVSTLVGYGIVTGKSDREFAPSDYVTRAEAAKMICLMMEVIDNA